MPNSIESVREQVRREALARALASGKSLDDAAQIARMNIVEALALSQEPATRELVEAINPEATMPTEDAIGEDLLAIIDRGAKSAALQLVADAGTSTPSAKALLELAIKLRAAHDVAPPKVVVQMPASKVEPLLAAITEFNQLMATLLEEDARTRA